LSERVGVWAELEDATNTSRMYTKYEGAFSLRFFEYLSRILLNHDNTSKQWWERKVRELPRKNDPVFTFAAFESQSKDERRAFREQVLRDAREQQYSEFVAAVELSVARRYSATSAGVVSLLQFLSSEPGWYQTPDGCKQLAICFSFVDNANQPTAAIDRLLAESEARSVTDITLTNPGSGYTGAVPTVTVAPPRAAMFKPDGRALSAVDAAKAAGAAKATATLRPSGRIARIVVKNGGKGYSSRSPPVVTIAPPLALSDSADIFGLEVGEDRNDRPDMFATATATAEVKGGIVVAILIQTKGAGYQFGGDTENASGPSVYNTAPPLVTIAPPSGSLLTADAEAVLDQEVASISVDLRGYGYSPEQLQRPGGLVSVQTPAECGGQATGVAASATASISPPVPLVKQPGGPEELRKFGSAYAQSVSAVLTSLLPTAATKLVRDGSGTIDGTSAGGLGSVAAAAAKGKELVMKTGGLPAEVDCSRCYGLWKVDGLPAAGELDKFGAQGLEFWPGGFPAERKRGEGVDVVFGRRAKVPVEKEEPLSLANFGKIALSGAICSSFGHTLLTPIELVKTRLQLAEEAAANKAPKTPAGATKGKKVEEVRLAKEVPSIPSIVSGIYRDEGGIAGLFAGWESATFGHFLSGAAGFGCTELFRRALLIEGGGFAALDSQGINRGIVILVASLSAGILSTVIIAPFEKARVRLQKSNEPEPATALDTLKGPFRFARGLFNSKKLTDGAKKPTETQPKTLAQALTILYKDERGPIPGFFDNVPLLLVRDTVYAMVKFLTFDKVRTAIFLALPIARESFASSLQVSLVSGSAAGMLAALVSQPGDTVFTKVSVEKEAAAGVKKRGPVEIVKDVLKDQGVAGLYVGSVERLLFAGILIAVEFAVYDYLRILLKVTNDDLVLVLDVLAG
jgi:solute carrier family 25 phosphate transporter 3